MVVHHPACVDLVLHGTYPCVRARHLVPSRLSIKGYGCDGHCRLGWLLRLLLREAGKSFPTLPADIHNSPRSALAITKSNGYRFCCRSVRHWVNLVTAQFFGRR